MDYSIKYQVGYQANQWLINTLTKLGIEYTLILDFIFINKANKNFDKMLNKRKFVKLRPVIIVENDSDLIDRYVHKTIKVDNRKILILSEDKVFSTLKVLAIRVRNR